MIIDDSKQLGTFIKMLRKRLNIAQKNLALSAGTGLRFIVDLEKGKPTCHMGKTLTVLKTLGVKINLIPPIGLDKEPL